MAAFASSQVNSRICKGIRIEIDQNNPEAASFLTPKAVENELGDLPAAVVGTPLSKINTAKLEKHLRKINNFENVECVLTADGYLLVSVTPIIPEARIFSDKGTYYINRDGKRLDAHAAYFADLPVVHGNFTDKMPAKGVLPVVHKIKDDKLLSSLVTMIDYRNPQNIILIPRIRGHVINLGDTTRLNSKIAALRLFYDKVIPFQGWNKYDTISVKFRGQIVATRADKRRTDHSTHFDDEDPDPEEQIAQQESAPTTEPAVAPKPAPSPQPAPQSSPTAH